LTINSLTALNHVNLCVRHQAQTKHICRQILKRSSLRFPNNFQQLGIVASFFSYEIPNPTFNVKNLDKMLVFGARRGLASGVLRKKGNDKINYNKIENNARMTEENEK